MSLSINNNKISKDNFKWSLKKLSIILQPFVPHISEEIWSNFKEGTLCINEEWPIEIVQKNKVIKIAIQINGKTKEIIEHDEVLNKEEVLAIVKKNKKIEKHLSNKNLLREIYVPKKIINFVIQ